MKMIKTGKQQGMILSSVILIALIFSTAGIYLMDNTSAWTMDDPVSSIDDGSLTTHEPIMIDGDDGFTAENGTSSGSGTEADPFIIENLKINSDSGDGIAIKNTEMHFTIRNCHIYGTGIGDPASGILIESASNGKVESCVLMENSWCAVSISYSSGGIITGNFMSGNLNGVEIYDSSNIEVRSNTIEGSDRGVDVVSSPDNIIDDNQIDDNEYGLYMSSYMGPAENNVISANTFEGNSEGLHLEWDCKHNEISDNEITDSENYGVILTYSSEYNEITGNTLTGNKDGIFLFRSPENIFEENTIEDGSLQIGGDSVNDFYQEIDNTNLVNGNAIIYYSDESGVTLEDQTVGQVIAVNCDNLTISAVTVDGGDVGMEFAFCSYVTIQKSSISGNDMGINFVDSPEEVDVNFNSISGNLEYGIYTNDISTSFDATNNWWGDQTGPVSDNGAFDGSGDKVSDDVPVSPWLQELNLNILPEVSASSDTIEVETDQEVTFSGEGTDDDGTIASYHWDFGDGSTSSDEDPVHIFDKAGTYQIVLTVTDDSGGESTDTLLIVVSSSGEEEGGSAVMIIVIAIIVALIIVVGVVIFVIMKKNEKDE